MLALACQVGYRILSGGLEGSPAAPLLSHAGPDSESTCGIRRWRDRGDENASGTTRAVIASMHGDPAQATIRVGRQDFVCDNDICASLHECWRNDPPAWDIVDASPQAVRGIHSVVGDGSWRGACYNRIDTSSKYRTGASRHNTGAA